MKIGDTINYKNSEWECISGGKYIAVIQKKESPKAKKRKVEMLKPENSAYIFHLAGITSDELLSFYNHYKTTGKRISKGRIFFIGLTICGLRVTDIAKTFNAYKGVVGRWRNYVYVNESSLREIDKIVRDLAHWRERQLKYQKTDRAA